MTYALHYGLADDDVTVYEVAVAASHAIHASDIVGIYHEGDSFIEWGETIEDDDANPHPTLEALGLKDRSHGVLYFAAPDDDTAVKQGTHLYFTLARHGIADPLANCGPYVKPGDPVVPYAVTDADDWSISYKTEVAFR